MKHLSLNLRSGQSDIYVDLGLIKKVPELLTTLDTNKRAFIFWDDHIPLIKSRLIDSLQNAGWATKAYSITALETNKQLSYALPLYEKLLNNGANRGDLIISLGGGVVGDMVGFLASTYMRGTPWINIPTTLLAQVDSAIGGKTALNHPAAKNLIGTFYQPRMVFCDTSLLYELPAAAFYSGLGEVYKYAIALDKSFFQYLATYHKELLSRQPEILTHIVESAIKNKCAIVKQDEFDTKGMRSVLNFGHTVGHALESLGEYQGLSHGQAVIWGMKCILELSQQKQIIDPGAFDQAHWLLNTIPTSIIPNKVSADTLWEMVQHDKKKKNDQITFILLKNIGKTTLRTDISKKEFSIAVQKTISAVS